jgi:lipopolysaccharide/colanic/teichoic acid biosynthesis glycosyltransferase
VIAGRSQFVPDTAIGGITYLDEMTADRQQVTLSQVAVLDDPITKESRWFNSRRKRLFDLFTAVPILVISGPVLGMIACAIKLTSRGPVLFKQTRVGKNQVPFVIYKFRTMTELAEDLGSTVTKEGDPRRTRFGVFLRKSKLDELPQLLNVLRGDMSLVGPRPKLAEHETMYLTCRPGITGAATLLFAREEELLAKVPESFLEDYARLVLGPIKVKVDQEYIQGASFLTDLRILASTALPGRRRGLFRLPTPAPDEDILSMGSLLDEVTTLSPGLSRKARSRRQKMDAASS